MIYPSIPQSFWDGTCFDAYRRMGAHPAAGDKGEAGWQFILFAPGRGRCRSAWAAPAGPIPSSTAPTCP